MNSLRNVAREIVGLFVDDGSFAIQIILSIATVYALSRVVDRPTAEAILLFAALAGFLAFSVIRFARRSRHSDRQAGH